MVRAPQTRDDAAGAEPDVSVEAPPESVAQAPRVVDARGGSRWYGWQTLATDGAAVALLVGGIAAESGEVVGFSAATFALGGPIVHLAHGRGGAAAASLGIRVGVSVAGFFAGAAAAKGCDHSEDNYCDFQGAAIGMVAGAGVAMILDTVFLAHESVRREQPERAGRVVVSPAVAVTKSSGTVGLTGTF